MKKIMMCLLALSMTTTAVMSQSKIALRGFPWWGANNGPLTNPNNFPSSHGKIDYGYSANDADAVGAPEIKNVLTEFYVFWDQNTTNDGGLFVDRIKGITYQSLAEHPLIKTLRDFGGGDGSRIHGLKIARENVGDNVNPPGPIDVDTRILFESDLANISYLIDQAEDAGLLAPNIDIKLYQMVFEPDAFSNNKTNPTELGRAQNIIKLMDGVCFELHHLSDDYYPLYGFINNKPNRTTPSRVIDGAMWVLNNKNTSNEDLEYIFYYGPWRYYRTDASIKNDIFYEWLEEYWANGFPQSHPRVIYDLNAFPHAGNDRPFGNESDGNPSSMANVLRWLVGKVDNVPGGPETPAKVVQFVKMAGGFNQTIDAGGSAPQNNVDGANVYTFSYNESNMNQWWQEIPKGDQHYTYIKVVGPGGFALDGGGLDVDGGNVKLWTHGPNNYNQQWKKIDMGNGNFMFRKRNATDFVLDGSNGDINFNNVKIWTDFGNGNQQWSLRVIPL